MEFKDLFCLNSRESFTIDPVINPSDAKFYFGRSDVKGKIQRQLVRSFVDPGVPKIVLYGPYGSGKTQTLYHIKYMLDNEKPRSLSISPKTVVVILEMQSKSQNLDWHRQLMEGLGRDDVTSWVERLFSTVPDLDQALAELFSDHNLIQATKNMRGGGELPLIAWRWLSGQHLSNAELQRLQLTRNLGDIGSADLVNVLVGLGRLSEMNGEKLIFLMDEVESFQNITNPDAVESVHNYMRRLAEPQNSSVGFVISSFALTQDQMADMLTRRDVESRIGAHNYIEIFPLPNVQDVRLFTQELLTELIDGKRAEEKIQQEGLETTLNTYPFNSESFDLFCEYASQDYSKSLPRNIIRAVNECAISAWDVETGIIDEQIVNEIAPLVFD